MNKRKIEVVNHALALFIEKGIIQTSIHDIIERSGISKGTFYNYFLSKNECISAVLEKIRYETRVSRSELQIGKNPNDVEVLIEQISMLWHRNQKYGLASMFDEMLHSHDIEMKRYVTQFRVFEIEWLAERLVDVHGEPLRVHAFEAALIFFGIQRQLQFAARMINQTDIEPRDICRSVIRYMNHIIECLINNHTAVLSAEKIQALKSQTAEEKIEKTDILHGLDELSTHCRFTKTQAELTAALRYEMEQQPLREAVINALLQPFLDAFKSSPNYVQSKDIMTMIWRYMNQH